MDTPYYRSRVGRNHRQIGHFSTTNLQALQSLFHQQPGEKPPGEKKAPTDIDFYFLDLFAHRQLSDKIARNFAVEHESPQVLLIRNARCIYDESHLSIRMDEIEAQNMAA